MLIGPENLKIAKHDIVLMIVKHLPLLKMYLACGEYTYLDVNVFSVVTDHATLTHLLKQLSDKLTDRQVH